MFVIERVQDACACVYVCVGACKESWTQREGLFLQSMCVCVWWVKSASFHSCIAHAKHAPLHAHTHAHMRACASEHIACALNFFHLQLRRLLTHWICNLITLNATKTTNTTFLD